MKPDYKKPALKLLLEALEQPPNPPHTKNVQVSEYSWSVATAAKECIQELQEMFSDKPTGE